MEEETLIEYIDDNGVHVLSIVDAAVQEASLRARICAWPEPHTKRFEAFDALVDDLTELVNLLWAQGRIVEAIPELRRLVLMVRNETLTMGVAPAYMRAFAEALIRRAGADLDANVPRFTRPLHMADLRDLLFAARMLEEALRLPCGVEKQFYDDILCLQETLNILGISAISLMP